MADSFRSLLGSTEDQAVQLDAKASEIKNPEVVKDKKTKVRESFNSLFGTALKGSDEPSEVTPIIDTSEADPSEAQEFKKNLNENPPTMASALVTGVGQGVLADFADEAVGLAQGESGELRVKETEARYPTTTAAGKFIGSLLPAGAVFKGVKGLRVGMQAIANSPKLAAIVDASMASGILSGAFSLGASKEKDVEAVKEAGKDAAEGLVFGGAAAVAAPALFNSLRGSNGFETMMHTVARYGGQQGERMAAAVFANQFVTKAGNIAADLTKIGAVGGLGNVVIQDPKDFDEAVDAFQTGAGYAVTAGLVSKTLLGSVRLVNKYVTKGGQAKFDQELTQMRSELKAGEQSLKIAEDSRRAARLEKQASVKNLKEVTAERDLLKRQAAKYEGLVANETEVADRVASLRDRMFSKANRESSLSTTMDDLGTAKQSIIESQRGKMLDVTAPIAQSERALNGVRTATSTHDEALSSAKRVVDNLKSNFARSETNPMASGPRKVNYSVDIADLDTDLRQVRDLLYNREWFTKAQGTPLRKVMTGLERALTDQINASDPSGKVKQLNAGITALYKASELADDTLNIGFINSLAKNPSNPKVRQFVSQYNKIASDAAKAVDDPDYSRRLSSYFRIAQSELDHAATDYSVLNQAKQELPRMYRRLDSVDDAIKRRSESIPKASQRLKKAETAEQKAGLSQARRELDIETKLGNRPENALEAILPERMRIVSETRDAFLGDPTVRDAVSLGRTVENTLAPARGALPATLANRPGLGERETNDR